MKHFIKHSELRRLLNYDPSTGIFTWRLRRGPMKTGSTAGTIQNHGYRSIKVKGRLYQAHRLAWLYVNGEWPAEEIDHRDCERLNNRIDNLRAATRLENARNTRLYSNNKTGARGVSWNRLHRKFYASIQINKKTIFLGLFTDLEKAKQAYAEAAKKHHGAFASQI